MAVPRQLYPRRGKQSRAQAAMMVFFRPCHQPDIDSHPPDSQYERRSNRYPSIGS